MDTSLPPSPVCHSVEMDVYLGQSELSGPSFLSLPDSSSHVRDSPSSVRAHTHLDTTQSYNSAPVSCLRITLCFLLSLAAGEQGVHLQYPGLLGRLWPGASDRRSMSRQVCSSVAVLRQPPQSAGGRVSHHSDPGQGFTYSGPSAPAEEEKGRDAAAPGLAPLRSLHHRSWPFTLQI